MAVEMKQCRVCGKLFEPCHTAKRNEKVFRWQDIACSRECGETYLANIRASRGQQGKTPVPAPAPDIPFKDEDDYAEDEYESDEDSDIYDDTLDE